MHVVTDSDSMRYTEPERGGFAAEVEVVSDNVVTSEWRQIVERCVLAKSLQHYVGCQMQIQVQNCVGETTCGLGSILHIRCDNP